MNTNLNSLNLLPLVQPYNGSPWPYPGFETVEAIPNSNVIDWVLVEFRDAVNAASANAASRIERQAGFLLNNSSIVGTDGASPLYLSASVVNNLFVVIWHINHLEIMSANPLNLSGGGYTYDSTTGSAQAHGTDGQKAIATGIWGMYSGNGDANNTINNTDKTADWTPNVGKKGYLNGDFNRNGQVSNQDKNNYWLSNINKSSQVP